MSLHALIEFVQQHYSSLQGAPDGRQRNPNVIYEPYPGDLDAIQTERPPVPDWLPEEGDDSVFVLGADDVLSPDGELPPSDTHLRLPGNGVTTSTLPHSFPYPCYSSPYPL